MPFGAFQLNLLFLPHSFTLSASKASAKRTVVREIEVSGLDLRFDTTALMLRAVTSFRQRIRE